MSLLIYSIIISLLWLKEKKERKALEDKLLGLDISADDRLSNKVAEIRNRLGKVNKSSYHKPKIKINEDNKDE